MKLKLMCLAVITTLVMSGSALAQNTDNGITIKDVVITGATGEMLEQMLNVSKNKLMENGPMTVKDIKEVAEEMTQIFFRDKGYELSRVYLPVQSLDEKNAVLTLAVIEGKYGEVKIKGANGYNENLIQKRLGIQSGQLLDSAPLERGLLLVDDLPGLKLSGVEAVPGKKPGESDYTVVVEKEKHFSGAVLVDNQGLEAIGENRITAQVGYANPTGYGDEIEAGMTKSGRGLTSSRFAYTIPFTVGDSQGWKAALAASKVNYRLVDPALSLLDAYGTAQGFSAAVTYPIIRTQLTNMGFSTQLNYQLINDYIFGQKFNEKHSKSVSVGLTGDMTRNYFKGIGASQIVWTTATTFGSLDIKNNDAKIVDASGAKTNGSFYRLNGSTSINQNLDIVSPRLSAYLSMSGQHTTTNLDSSEKLVITGPTAVRGYAQGTVSADRGIVANAEIRYQLPNYQGLSSSVYGFYDVGHGKIYAKSYSSETNSQTVQAIGVGVTAQHKSGAFATASFSKGSGLKQVAGTTADNKFAWVQVGYKF